MRPDMKYLIHEKPKYRYHGCDKSDGEKYYHKQFENEDLAPKKDYFSKGKHAKHTVLLYNPLDQWFKSQVGRNWDDVWHEACERISSKSYTREVLDYYYQFCIERNCKVIDGKLYTNKSEELYQSRGYRGIAKYFVHPETNIFSLTPKRPIENKFIPHVCFHKTGSRYFKIDNIWYDCNFVKFSTDYGPELFFCQLANKPLKREEARAMYGEAVYCVSKKQIGFKKGKGLDKLTLRKK